MGNKQGESKKYAATNNHKTSKIQCDIPQSARLKPTSNQSNSVHCPTSRKNNNSHLQLTEKTDGRTDSGNSPLTPK